MLRIVVPAAEYFDERKNEFINRKEQVLQLEHSLISLSKWEAKWKKAFLGKSEKTTEETLDYIRCMTMTPNVDPEVYSRLTNENIRQVNDYISESMTATTFREDKDGKQNREIITSELIYYWMIAYGIPSEYQKWHLSRLLTLIRVCMIKSSPPKKRGKKEFLTERAELNALRKQQMHTKG